MGPSTESLALADFLISKLGLQVDRISLAYAIMDHVEIEYSEELSYEDRIAELEAALAARQPVEGIPGQPTRTYSLDVLGNPMRKDKNGVYESAEWPSDRQPVGEPAYNSAGIPLTACQLHEALLMAGDPELDVPFEDRSLVRIFWTETGHSGPGLYCECVGAEEEGCILLDGTAPAIGQSAQAVDLGQFRDLAEFALQNAKLHNCWEKREALARNLLALIDSHSGVSRD